MDCCQKSDQSVAVSRVANPIIPSTNYYCSLPPARVDNIRKHIVLFRIPHLQFIVNNFSPKTFQHITRTCESHPPQCNKTNLIIIIRPGMPQRDNAGCPFLPIIRTLSTVHIYSCAVVKTVSALIWPILWATAEHSIVIRRMNIIWSFVSVKVSLHAVCATEMW